MNTAGSANGSPGRTTRNRAWPSPGFSMCACSSNGPRLSTSREKSTTALPVRPSKAIREEGRSLRSSTMNALRAPSCSVSHSPLPATGSPTPADLLSRHVPGCGSPIVYGGPVQSGSRQSAPARNAWIVGVTAPVGTASSMVAFVSTNGTVDSKTVSVRNPATPG